MVFSDKHFLMVGWNAAHKLHSTLAPSLSGTFISRRVTSWKTKRERDSSCDRRSLGKNLTKLWWLGTQPCWKHGSRLGSAGKVEVLTPDRMETCPSPRRNKQTFWEALGFVSLTTRRSGGRLGAWGRR